MKEDNVALACVGLFVLVVASVVGGSIMNGWALSVLWGWFVVPLFNMPPLSIATAIGFSLVVAMLTHQEQKSDGKKSSTTEVVAGVVSRVVLTPLLTVFVGWIVKSFI